MKVDVASATEDRLSNSSHRRAPQASAGPYSLRLLPQTRSTSFGKVFRRLLVFEMPGVREATALQRAADSSLHASPAPRVRVSPAGGCSAEHAAAHAASVRNSVQTSMRECLTQLTNHTGMLHLETRLGFVTLAKASTNGEANADGEGDEPIEAVDEPTVDAFDDVAGTGTSISMAIDAEPERDIVGSIGDVPETFAIEPFVLLLHLSSPRRCTLQPGPDSGSAP